MICGREISCDTKHYVASSPFKYLIKLTSELVGLMRVHCTATVNNNREESVVIVVQSCEMNLLWHVHATFYMYTELGD